MISQHSRRLLQGLRLQGQALGQQSGDYHSNQPGQGSDFYDFRPYQRGDEPRHVDWRIYQRSGKLYTRLHHAERALQSSILLDTSRSMAIGGKFSYAQRLAGLLLYLLRDSASRLHSFPQAVPQPPLSNAHPLIGQWRNVQALAATAEGSSQQALARCIHTLPRQQGKHLMLILSDFFDPTPWDTTLTALRWRGFDAVIIQIVAQEDVAPARAWLSLQDAESDARLEADPSTVQRYHAQVHAFLEHCRQRVHAAGYRYLRLLVPPEPSTAEAQEAALLRALLASKLVTRG